MITANRWRLDNHDCIVAFFSLTLFADSVCLSLSKESIDNKGEKDGAWWEPKKSVLARSLPFHFQSCFLKLGFSKSYERTNRVVVCGYIYLTLNFDKNTSECHLLLIAHSTQRERAAWLAALNFSFGVENHEKNPKVGGAERLEEPNKEKAKKMELG